MSPVPSSKSLFYNMPRFKTIEFVTDVLPSE